MSSNAIIVCNDQLATQRSQHACANYMQQHSATSHLQSLRTLLWMLQSHSDVTQTPNDLCLYALSPAYPPPKHIAARRMPPGGSNMYHSLISFNASCGRVGLIDHILSARAFCHDVTGSTCWRLVLPRHSDVSFVCVAMARALYVGLLR